jgi:MFS family permease
MSLGSLMGLFFVPYIIDMFGRRSGVLVGSCIMILGVGLQTGARAARYAATPQSSLGAAFVAMLFIYGFFYDFKYATTNQQQLTKH